MSESITLLELKNKHLLLTIYSVTFDFVDVTFDFFLLLLVNII